MDQPHSINYNRTQQIGNIRHQQTGKRNNYRLIYVKRTEKTSQIFHTTLKQKHGLCCVSSELTLKYQCPIEKMGKKGKIHHTVWKMSLRDMWVKHLVVFH